MLLLVIWKNLKEKGEIKGYMCVCIIFEEKLKKIVINLKRINLIMINLKNIR